MSCPTLLSLSVRSLHLLPFSPLLQTSNLGDKLEDRCDGLLQRRKSEDAGSGIQVSGKCVLSSEDPLESGRQNFVCNFCEHHSCQKAEARFFRVAWSFLTDTVRA